MLESALISVYRRRENLAGLPHLEYWPLMDADERRYFDALTERVIGALFEVSNTLGAGFLEAVYRRALLAEFRSRGVRAVAEASFPVMYKGQKVGDYFADILVEDVLVIELKCVDRLVKEHTAQCINYLTASGLHVCLLVNFHHPKVEWKRIVNRFGSLVEADVEEGDLREVGP